jgi:hypothetical protein
VHGLNQSCLTDFYLSPSVNLEKDGGNNMVVNDISGLVIKGFEHHDSHANEDIPKDLSSPWSEGIIIFGNPILSNVSTKSIPSLTRSRFFEPLGDLEAFPFLPSMDERSFTSPI